MSKGRYSRRPEEVKAAKIAGREVRKAVGGRDIYLAQHAYLFKPKHAPAISRAKMRIEKNVSTGVRELFK